MSINLFTPLQHKLTASFEFEKDVYLMKVALDCVTLKGKTYLEGDDAATFYLPPGLGDWIYGASRICSLWKTPYAFLPGSLTCPSLSQFL